MANQNIYWKIKGILNEEPVLKEEFDELRSSLQKFSGDIPKVIFEKYYQEYEDFLDILVQLANLPKIKNKL